MTPVSNPSVYDNLTTQEKIGINVMICREQKKLSRKQLAAKMERTTATLIEIEEFWCRDKKNAITFRELELISKALEVPVSYLLPQESKV